MRHLAAQDNSSHRSGLFSVMLEPNAMPCVHSAFKRSALSFLCIVVLAGCACAPVQPLPALNSAPTLRDPVDLMWQRIRFHIHWNTEKEPDWHVDAMLAHRVVGPVLQRERESIALWRFHRRAGDDAAGIR